MLISWIIVLIPFSFTVLPLICLFSCTFYHKHQRKPSSTLSLKITSNCPDFHLQILLSISLKDNSTELSANAWHRSLVLRFLRTCFFFFFWAFTSSILQVQISWWCGLSLNCLGFLWNFLSSFWAFTSSIHISIHRVFGQDRLFFLSYSSKFFKPPLTKWFQTCLPIFIVFPLYNYLTSDT